MEKGFYKIQFKSKIYSGLLTRNIFLLTELEGMPACDSFHWRQQKLLNVSRLAHLLHSALSNHISESQASTPFQTAYPTSFLNQPTSFVFSSKEHGNPQNPNCIPKRRPHETELRPEAGSSWGSWGGDRWFSEMKFYKFLGFLTGGVQKTAGQLDFSSWCCHEFSVITN